MKGFLGRALFAPVSRGEQAVGWFLAGSILCNVGVLAWVTIPSLSAETRHWLEIANLVFLSIFVVEYLLRWWLCPLRPNPQGGRARYLIGFFPAMDLVAISSGLLPLVMGVNLEALRLVRLMRILSMMRMGRYSKALRLFGRVAYAKRGEFTAVLIVVAFVLLFSSSIMYYLESEAQPEVFSSIPASLWWGIVTLTTVGYGDATPVTEIGRVVGGLIALMGVGIAALPAGIMASGLHEAVVAERNQRMQPGQPQPQDQDPPG